MSEAISDYRHHVREVQRGLNLSRERVSELFRKRDPLQAGLHPPRERNARHHYVITYFADHVRQYRARYGFLSDSDDDDDTPDILCGRLSLEEEEEPEES